MPTIRDVAKLAGVAPITASRVINDSGYASEAVRRRVRQAADQLGYVPNIVARSLRSKQTHTLALVLTDITNPFWTTVARGVEDAASQAGFNVILCNTDESETKQQAYLDTLIQKRVDGLLLVPASSQTRPIDLLHQQKIPVVVLDRKLPGVCVDTVRSDSEGGAYQLTRLLLAHGHRRIAVISGPRGISTAEERVAGYRRALREAGIEPPEGWVRFGAFTVESGRQMTAEILTSGELPTALFAGNNFLAFGALKALRDANLQVPQQVSMVTFDDFPTTMMLDPFLTVAAQAPYEMGQRATQLLFKRLESDDPLVAQEIILPVVIIQRQSIQPLTGASL